jgi:fucose 4-O-acetylase-like acetyltransferase
MSTDLPVRHDVNGQVAAIPRTAADLPSATVTGAAAADRMLDIDRSKGLGILLVVWGHLAGGALLNAPLWFYVSVAVVYEFHMPFFMYLSGFVFFSIGAVDRFYKAPASYVWKRFDRLMVPFIAFGLFVVIGKYVAASLGPVDDGVSNIGSGIAKVIANAPDNPSLSIWYLLVLFVYSVVTPILWRIGGRHIAVLLLIGAAGWCFALPETFYAARIATYFVFFGMGGLIALHRERALPIMKALYLPALAVLGVLCYFLLSNRFALLCCGLASIPALHGLFLQDFWKGDRLFLTIGRYSMVIYLFNTIFIGIGKIGILRVIPHEGLMFLIAIGILFVIGVAGPVVVRTLLAAIRPLQPLLRYVD